ncbi:AAA family ATPase [Ruminococcus callidus]|jgi:DNA sulfur modification protein DndD|uniref:AAA family ATPase n=1 Tax=Ruminococcus callidus TaxID=40519 RepID=UPI0035215B38
MLLNEITLRNFRQFKGEHHIKFSVDPQKNVTVIMGENGSGKTTLAQAFTWCLYSETDFKTSSVLNLSYANEMPEGDVTTVVVELKLMHKDIEYTITRSQGYTKERTGVIKQSPTRIVIHYKDESGQIETVRESQTTAKIKEILPKELSRYFFFDGERIDKMSEEIQSGKSEEFASAVKRLLGLDTYSEALRHLGGDKRAGSRNSVIGSYNSAFDASTDSKIASYSREYDRLEAEINRLNSRKEDIEGHLPGIDAACEKLSEKIARNKDGERYQIECIRKRKEIQRNNVLIDSSSEKIISSFKQNYRYFFYKKLIADALEVLKNTDKVDKGIPDIHARTIEFLMKRGFCICGNEICDGSKELKNLQDLIAFIPPQSLGTLINTFSNECKSRTRSGENIYETVKNILAEVEERKTTNEDLQAEISDLEGKIKSFENIGQCQIQLNSYREDKRKKQSELDGINMQIGSLTRERDRQETERNKLALQSDDNKKIAIYKAYAEKIFEILSQYYSKREKEVRLQLENAINDIFKTIYKGGLSLKIDHKYNIHTMISDDSAYNGIMNDTSTAQSISIIFAFIAGVIKVARNADSNGYDLSAEAYPLVMDAPLSTFDKRRIQSVCETLPEIAEQIIIFIKDTDGEIAEQYMSDRIGASFEFDKKSETETCFKERS